MKPCSFCGYEFDQDYLGIYGCPNCEGDTTLTNRKYENILQPTSRLPRRTYDRRGLLPLLLYLRSILLIMNIETANTLVALSYLITKQQLTPAEIQALIKTTIQETK